MEDGDVIDAHLQQARTHLSSHRLLSRAFCSACRLLLPLFMIYLIDLEHLFRPPIFVVFDRLICVVAITLSSEVQDTFSLFDWRD